MKNFYKIIIILITFLLFAGCMESYQETVGSKENSTYQKTSTGKATEDINEANETKKANETKNEARENNNEADNTKNETDKIIIEEKSTLEGLTICIDPGHGKLTKKVKKTEPVAPGSQIMKAATAGGTVGIITKITEESLNLSVSLKLKKALAEKGAKIVMVRENNVCNMTNVERTEFWNSSGADLTIRIHANGSIDKNVAGVLMMVPGNKYIKDKDLLEKSALAGKYIMEAVLKNTKAKSKGTVKSTDLTGFNWSQIPVVLLEMGFMTNPDEDRILNTDDYQNKIVSGIVEGVENYHKSVKSAE